MSKLVKTLFVTTVTVIFLVISIPSTLATTSINTTTDIAKIETLISRKPDADRSRSRHDKKEEKSHKIRKAKSDHKKTVVDSHDAIDKKGKEIKEPKEVKELAKQADIKPVKSDQIAAQNSQKSTETPEIKTPEVIEAK